VLRALKVLKALLELRVLKDIKDRPVLVPKALLALREI
jgi:hypothetical protein